MAFPLAAGFALVGPLAAIGLYELSRRREAGLDCSAGHVLDVLHSPSLAAIVSLGFLLMTIFLMWGLIVTALLVTGSVAFLLGLTVVIPVLGHATCHLYRKAVEADPNPHAAYQPRNKSYRSAADFPAALFPAHR